jgi:intermediate cleaving peptidase 55
MEAVTPGISAQEYHDRRANLMSQLPVHSLVILESATVKYASSSVFYPFHQDPNFLYLTGFQEEHAVALLERTGEGPDDFVFTLGVRPKNAVKEQWEGSRSGVDAARDVFNADVAFDVGDLRHMISPILRRAKTTYVDYRHAKLGEAPSKVVALLRDSRKGEPRSIQQMMDRLRLRKSPAELRNMRKAGQVAARAITNLMRREWASEHDIAARFEYDVKINGCESMAFVPVVAGGSNGLCVHYVRNDQAIVPGTLIQVDAGGRYGNYVSDISRVWPQAGKFSSAQRDLYLAVLAAQRHCVSLCRADKDLSLDDIHRVAAAKMWENLKQLGFADSTGGSDIMAQLFPHHVGHFVGLDVHDCSTESRSQKLEAGMCVTVEPGVYVPPDERYPRHFWGMGIRIEDCVAVDESSAYVLTTEAVKEIDDIEALRG